MEQDLATRLHLYSLPPPHTYRQLRHTVPYSPLSRDWLKHTHTHTHTHTHRITHYTLLIILLIWLGSWLSLPWWPIWIHLPPSLLRPVVSGFLSSRGRHVSSVSPSSVLTSLFHQVMHFLSVLPWTSSYIFVSFQWSSNSLSIKWNILLCDLQIPVHFGLSWSYS